jgi:hypothetical protein
MILSSSGSVGDEWKSRACRVSPILLLVIPVVVVLHNDNVEEPYDLANVLMHD